MVRHSIDPARKIELLHQIGELYEIGGEDARARSRPTIARCARSRGSRRRRRASSGWRARSIAGRTWCTCTTRSSSRWPSPRATSSCRSQLLTRVAQIEETQLGDNDAAAAAYHRVLKVAPQQLDAANALEAIYLRTDAYTKLVDVVLAKVDIVPDTAEKKELLLQGGADLRGGAREPRSRDRRLPAGPVARRERSQRDRRARAPLHPPRALGAAQGRLREEGRAGRRSRTRRSRCSSCSGRSTTASSRTSTRAIETYQTILDLDPEDVTGDPGARSALQQAERWYDLLQILEREVELSPSTGETVSLKHRIGQLWEKELKDLARAVEAYREVLAHRRHARADAAWRSTAWCTATRSRCWRRRCSSRSSRRAASGRSSSTCSR